MLTSLTIKHWRTHADTKLEFGKGTNVIVGVMGSGKSSIVNAISHSLFGTFPALKTRQVSLEEIIMNKPNEQARAETILEFEQGESKFRVERIIKRDGTNEAKLYENAKLVAGPKQKDVNERIEKLLGLNYELFSRAVYSEQNEMDFFLKLSPSERKKKFDELLELEKYEEARKNAVALQNELTKENKQRKEFITSQKQTIQSHEEEKIRKQIADEEKELARLELEIGEISKDKMELEKKYVEYTRIETQNKGFEDSLLKIGSKIESLKEDVAKGEKIS
ncbi:MAG: AAA family ATPase, partial [archaeon]